MNRRREGLALGAIAWMAVIFGATMGVLDYLGYIGLMH